MQTQTLSLHCVDRKSNAMRQQHAARVLLNAAHIVVAIATISMIGIEESINHSGTTERFGQEFIIRKANGQESRQNQIDRKPRKQQ